MGVSVGGDLRGGGVEGGGHLLFFGLFSSPPSPCRLSLCVPLLSPLSEDLSPPPPILSPPSPPLPLPSPSLPPPSSEDGGRGGWGDGEVGPSSVGNGGEHWSPLLSLFPPVSFVSGPVGLSSGSSVGSGPPALGCGGGSLGTRPRVSTR